MTEHSGLTHPAYGRLRQVTPYAAVMLCENPGLFELEGTNTWILRAPESQRCVVVDPGPDDHEHLRRVAQQWPVELTLITHRHGDHTGGVDHFLELSGAPIRAVDPRFRRAGMDGRPGDGLPDGAVITAAGLRIEVLATPGHTADSVSLLVDDPAGGSGVVLTGDTILGRGTTVLDHTDGSLGDYLASLEVLIEAGAGRRCLPGHGPELPDVAEVAQQYRAHRHERLEQVRGALRELGDDATPRAVVEHVYQDVDESLWPAAEMSVRVQLDYLRS
ncbi:MBL fold metallo-hydrolase [Rhodococcus sp. D2-41]|uniref:MBL fold metallo-hydrolase n=1 Tax=Speluncibacter jeojiensis TaxID=2710754 RepID=A0A9X4M332_9ACTN|nr:MBL fold metallo-hydrolase [Rhodococcus sp. D2-41]MDG3009399.1 MBL fold metallo-hydrolase [Rhodococcus sp. D2-41]MDG3016974.1 MBL fold metallo-hydrolase [Corynebacteriales bacterium D3-21]